jgi:hypothetical protein
MTGVNMLLLAGTGPLVEQGYTTPR